MQSAIQGFSLGLSLILAIGAQNAFVLRQGLKRAHVFAVCLTCALSDAILIAAGVAGFGWIVETAPWLSQALRYAGAVFLIAYGLRSAMAAWRGGESLRAEDGRGQGLAQAVLTCLALTWLNPHVYLDTVVLLGSISRQAMSPLLFGTGAVISSFVFFFSLGYGARLLAPIFARPVAWRILDAGVALIMWSIALSLIIE